MHAQGWNVDAKQQVAIKNYFVEMNFDLMNASVPYLRSLQV